MDNMDVDNEEPRGIKRKAEDPDPFRAPKRIKVGKSFSTNGSWTERRV